MELTAIAQFLNTTFAAFDQSVLAWLHEAAASTNNALTPLMKLLGYTSMDGIMLYILSGVLMLFKRTRRVGLCTFGAICCGALITNLILKPIVLRPRPYEHIPQVMEWLRFVGGELEPDTAFPSGHTTAAMACVTTLFLYSKRKSVTWTAFLYPFAVAFSRCYLMAHHPSDVLAALVIGGASAVIAYPIANGIFVLLRRFDNVPLFRFLLNADFLGKKPRKK